MHLHWPNLSRPHSLLLKSLKSHAIPTCYNVHSRTRTISYFNRQSLAIKASVCRPRFTWHLPVCNLLKFFPSLPPSLWRWVRCTALQSLKLGHFFVVPLSLCSDFLQACWLICLCTLLTNQYSCPTQHMLFTTQLVVLGR